MTGIAHDLRFALRQFAARPLFTFTAIATMALGIGANAAIFSVIDGLMLDPLPFVEADRLALAWRSSPSSEMMLTPDGELIERWRDGSSSFEAIEAWTTEEAVVRTAAGPHAVRTAAITDGLLGALRVAPVIGRGFRRDDEAAGAEPVALLSHAFWRAEFGGARDVIGRSLVIGGRSHTIIGVAPPELVIPMESGADPELWVPLRRNAQGRLDGRGLQTIVRMHSGVERERAEADLTAITSRGGAGEDSGFRSARLVRPADLLGPNVQRALLLLFGAVAFVLLIACANVANLLLVRASAREVELSVRAALGAGRGRLIRQLLVESLVLGLGGGIAGMVLATWGLDLIVSIRPESLAELERVRIDGRVAGYAALLALVTSTLFGLLPALRVSHAAGRLRFGARTVAGGRSTRRVTGALIVTEVALSLVLLIGAGLLVRTFFMLQSAPLNFDPAGLWVASAELPRLEGEEDGGNRDGLFHERLRDAVDALPGIRSAQLVLAVPSGYGASFGALAIDGGPAVEDAPALFASNFVRPDYFSALGMRFVEGRAFTEADGADVVVVGEAFARRFLPGGAVGHRIRLGESDWRTVVGVAADIPARGLAQAAAAPDQLHFPAGSYPLDRLLIDTDLSADALAPALRSVIARLDQGAALAELVTVEERLARSLDRQRFNLTLLLVLAALATVLSAVGLYGVVSVAVAGRTREIGIRRALGATDAGVIRLAVRDGMVPALIGIAVGLLAALAVTGLMARLLYGLSPRDPVTHITVPVLLAAVALAASWLPGRRAARIEPVEALRSEA